jgi:hypothetical protein
MSGTVTADPPQAEGRPRGGASPDWELDFYSRPVLDPDGKKRWELLICSTPVFGDAEAGFRWVKICPATSVNSIWLQEALLEALRTAADQGFGAPRRLRCWRGSMRTMVERAALATGLELVPSRRCYALLEWLRERELEVYPHEEGYMAGPLAPPPQPPPIPAVPLPEQARGDSWSWASLPASAFSEAGEWDVGFSGLVKLPSLLSADTVVPGLRLFSRRRALAIAGWLAGLEPVRLSIDQRSLVLDAGLENRWLLARLQEEEAIAALEAFEAARREAGGLQFLAIQSDPGSERFEGFWLLRDLPES